MNKQLPEYLSYSEQYKKRGMDELILISANDPFVMAAFASYMGVFNRASLIADTEGLYLEALGLGTDLREFGLGPVSSKRFVGVIKRGLVVEGVEEWVGGGRVVEWVSRL